MEQVIAFLDKNYGVSYIDDIDDNEKDKIINELEEAKQLLSKMEKPEPKPKPETLKVVLDKTVSFLRREIKFYFKVSLNVSKIEE